MAHEQESQNLTPERVIENMGSVLGGIESFVETAERIIASLHLIAKSVQSMEEDGSLSRLAEFLQGVEQAQSGHTDDSHRKARQRLDQDNV